MSSALIVSIHDIAPQTAAACRTWRRCLERRGVPATLLAVPHWRGAAVSRDPQLVGWLRDRVEAGDEVALHGLCHESGTPPRRADPRMRTPGLSWVGGLGRVGGLGWVGGLGGRGWPGGFDPAASWRTAVDRLVARVCAEFWSLPEAEALRRLSAGMAELDRCGLSPAGFTPPGWLQSAGARRAVRAAGLRYTTSHLGVHDLSSGRRYRVPALSQRAYGRGERAAATLVRRALPALARCGHDVRLALHPADVRRSALVAATLDALDDAMAEGAVPVTYLTYLDERRRG